MLTHNINPVSGEQNNEFQQVYDSALYQGLEKSGGVRVPTFPKVLKQKSEEAPPRKVSIFPKTLKQQQSETKRILKKNQGFIKILKPVLTADGFKIELPQKVFSDNQTDATTDKQSEEIRSLQDNEEVLDLEYNHIQTNPSTESQI